MAITKDMTFGELIQQLPEAGPILGSYGLHCIGCHISTIETIEQGVKAHGFDEATLEKILAELNAKAAQ